MLEIGQIVTWMYQSPGGYGYVIPVRAEIVKFTEKRVKIRVWRKTLKGDEPVFKFVKSSSLKSSAPNKQN